MPSVLFFQRLPSTPPRLPPSLQPPNSSLSAAAASPEEDPFADPPAPDNGDDHLAPPNHHRHNHPLDHHHHHHQPRSPRITGNPLGSFHPITPVSPAPSAPSIGGISSLHDPAAAGAAAAAGPRSWLQRLDDAFFKSTPRTWVSQDPAAFPINHAGVSGAAASATATAPEDWTLRRTRAEERIQLALGAQKKVNVVGPERKVEVVGDEDEGADDPHSWEETEKWSDRQRKETRKVWEDGKERKALRRFSVESFFALFLAMIGFAFAGVVLDQVQHFAVFKQVTELFILVPVILNLKSSLELNLASRLSEAANSDTLSFRLVMGNIALVQLQALLAAFASGLWVYILGGIINGGHFESEKGTSLVVSVSLITASLASLASSILMSIIVAVCKQIGIDPDNIATPLAASTGDLFTLVIMSAASVILGQFLSTNLPLIAGIIFLMPIPICWWLVSNNEFARPHIEKGWGAIFLGMAIATGAGIALERAIKRFPGLALVTPVLTGLAGCVGAIHASRWATRLLILAKEALQASDSVAATPKLGPASISTLFAADESAFGKASIFRAPESQQQSFSSSWRIKSNEEDQLATKGLLSEHTSDENRRPPQSVITAEAGLVESDPMRRSTTGEHKKDDEFDIFNDEGPENPLRDAERSVQLLTPWSTATTLFAISIPVHWIFLLIIAFLNMAKTSTSGLFSALLPYSFANLNSRGGAARMLNSTASVLAHAANATKKLSSLKALNRTVSAASRTADISRAFTNTSSSAASGQGPRLSQSISVKDPAEYALIFFVMYTLVAAFATACVLWLAGVLTRYCFRKGWSASSALPVIAALADLLGTGLLIGGFFMVRPAS